MKKIGLVTVLYKSDDVLEEFYESIHTQSYENYYLYLIDNSPTQETRIIVAALNTKYNITNVIHIENDGNLGVAAGNNIGIKLALKDNCEGVVLLNNDILFKQRDLFKDLVTEAIKSPTRILAPKVYFAGTNKLWYGGGYFTLWRGGTNHIGYEAEDNGQFDSGTESNYAPTCFVYIGKEVFESVGYMDERYFVYVDDTDFIYRALKNGFQILFLPNLHIYHKVSLSTGGVFSDFGLYYNTRNRVFWVRKSITGWKKYTAFLYIFYNAFVYSVKQKGIGGSLKRIKKAMVEGFKMKL